ncbi:uncharacterized protein LOC141696718 [Apium graveolens]|uniref:uncharacterized protein LOC141696718 n=1 Tax=Apium graveolens TaxID=4045 RepID=UPI003D78BB29
MDSEYDSDTIEATTAIYAALTKEDAKTVRDMCQEHAEGPFLVLNQFGDSVLQKALYSGQVDLVLDLLNDANQRWPQGFRKKLGDHVNVRKNNVLHVAATQDSCLRAAHKIFQLADHLLTLENNDGETPLFLAARYGQLKMFTFLNSQIQNLVSDEEDSLSFYQFSGERKKYTVLHLAIYKEHFVLALYIAKKIPSLICEENHMKMTGLHYLAMNSSAFRKQDWKWLKLFIPSSFRRLCKLVDEILDEDFTGDDHMKAAAVCPRFTMTIPWWDRIKEEYERYEVALQLGVELVENDKEWRQLISSYKLITTSVSNTYEADYIAAAAPATLDSGDANTAAAQTNQSADTEIEKPPTTLTLATKYGCLEIARTIIQYYPQTVEQVDPKYGSLLHLAIKYRRIKIFDDVVNMPMQMRKLVRCRDGEGNSILHMVALNPTKVKDKNGNDATSTKNPKAGPRFPWDSEEITNETRSPAFELQDDLLLFERVEKILKTYHHKTLNKNLQTADQLFAAKKEPLRDAAQEWMKRTAENCSIVAVLIATVAFAAAYTVPGGSNPENGSPVLVNQTFFVVFTVSDVLSLASTLTAVVVFLSILTSSFQFEDFKESLPKRLMFGISCLIFSLTIMMLAFAATIILMIKNRQQWTRIALYGIAFLPVSVLVATYLPFYVPLMRTFHYTVAKVETMLPRFRVQWGDIHKSSLFKNKEPTTSSNQSMPV